MGFVQEERVFFASCPSAIVDPSPSPSSTHKPGGKEGTMLPLRVREEGQGLVEYGLIIFLVAIVIIAILVLLGPQIGSIFSRVTGSI